MGFFFFLDSIQEACYHFMKTESHLETKTKLLLTRSRQAVTEGKLHRPRSEPAPSPLSGGLSTNHTDEENTRDSVRASSVYHDALQTRQH